MLSFCSVGRFVCQNSKCYLRMQLKKMKMSFSMISQTQKMLTHQIPNYLWSLHRLNHLNLYDQSTIHNPQRPKYCNHSNNLNKFDWSAIGVFQILEGNRMPFSVQSNRCNDFNFFIYFFLKVSISRHLCVYDTIIKNNYNALQ